MVTMYKIICGKKETKSVSAEEVSHWQSKGWRVEEDE